MTANAVIATTPAAMVEAKGKLLAWVDVKLQSCEEERQQAEALLVQLRLARGATNHANKLLDACRRRERFYEKVRAALEAGYYIIPPFEAQIFAIRTDRDTPPQEVDTDRTKWDAPKGLPALPAGVGRYVAPLAERSFDHDVKRTRTDNQVVTDNYYSNDAWREVEFPVRAMKPQLIEAAGRAMEALIFDSLAIAPQYRSADPIIAGQIKHYKANRTPLTFFVAWWLDEDDL